MGPPYPTTPGDENLYRSGVTPPLMMIFTLTVSCRAGTARRLMGCTADVVSAAAVGRESAAPPALRLGS